MKKREIKSFRTTKKIKWSFVSITLLFVISAVFISGCAKNGQSAPTAKNIVAPEKKERAAFAIEKMSCASCAAGIEAMLKRTPGVISAEASFERKEAIVEFNPSETSPEKLVEAIDDMGYKASVKN